MEYWRKADGTQVMSFQVFKNIKFENITKMFARFWV